MNWIGAAAFGMLALLAVFASGASFAQDAEVVAPERGLQTELEPRSAEDDWRAEVGLVQPPERQANELPDVLVWILANLVWLIFLVIALIILILIVVVLINQGRGGGFRFGAEAVTGQRSDVAGTGQAVVLDAPRLTLDDIMRLDDLESALGALLRLVLETAVDLTGRVLKRSATAREALRLLPADFAYLSAVVTVVREAERVRYGGVSITRDRFEELVGLVRPWLTTEPSA